MRASLHGLRESTWRGCYEPLLEPAPGQGRIYYVEFFRTRRSASEVRSLYERRRTEHKNFTLNLLIERIATRARSGRYGCVDHS